jgi:hypothetical protein
MYGLVFRAFGSGLVVKTVWGGFYFDCSFNEIRIFWNHLRIRLNKISYEKFVINVQSIASLNFVVQYSQKVL